MGACTQRPSKNELDNHETIDKLTHDAQFLPLPTVTASLEVLKTNPSRLNQEQMRLNQTLNKYKQKRATFTRGAILIPSLRFEIKKGKNVGTGASCFNEGGSTVTVRLNPNGPELFKTKKSTAVIPEWFEFCNAKQSLESFDSIQFAVDIEGSKYGAADLRLDSLRNQEVITKWVPLTGTPSTEQAEILVRVQLVTDEGEVMDRQIAECERLLKSLEDLVKK